ncbi:DUF3667 domain-containing protein [bacterium]|nr:DUF3667 domain-containing protein [bacterium]
MEPASETWPCKGCGAALYGNYCPQCGRPKELKRINGAYILTEIGSVLNFDKGLLFTMKELLIRPGSTVKEFITQDRNRLVKPVLFIIISSLVYSILKDWLRFEDRYVGYGDSVETNTTYLFRWTTDNYGYANLIIGVFIAFWTRLLFRKAPFNLFEILILLCFVMGLSMMILALFGLLEGLTKLPLLQTGTGVFLVYASWAIAQFFDGTKPLNYVKALAAYLLGMSSHALALLGLGQVLDLVA